MCLFRRRSNPATTETSNGATPADAKEETDEFVTPQEESAGINSVLLQRLGKLSPLLFPGICSVPTILFVLLLITCFLEQYIVYNVGLISSQYYLVLGQMDWPGFVSTTLYSIGLVVTIAVVLSGKNYISSILYISWRQVMTHALHTAYFSGVNYYAITITPNLNLDNPDMRMTQDVDLLCKTLGTMVATLIIAPFKISYYTYQAYAGTGWLGPTMILAFFALSSIVNRFVMNPIVPCVVQSEKCEGDLRFKHMQIRAGSESVAFHVSGSVEASKTNAALDELVRAKQRLFNRQFWLNLCQNLFDYLGSILSYLAIAVPIFGGAYDGVDSSTLSSIISKNAFVCIMLISSLSGLVGLCSSVVQLAGAAHRIGHLLEALQSLDRSWHAHNCKASASYTDLTRGGGGDDGASLPPPYSPRPHLATAGETLLRATDRDALLDKEDNPNAAMVSSSLRRSPSTTGREPPGEDITAHQKLISTSTLTLGRDLVVLSDNRATTSPPAEGAGPSFTVVAPAGDRSPSLHRPQQTTSGEGTAAQEANHGPNATAESPFGRNTASINDTVNTSHLLNQDHVIEEDAEEKTIKDVAVTNNLSATSSTTPAATGASSSVQPFVSCDDRPTDLYPEPLFSGTAFPVGFLLQSVTLRVPGTNNTLVKDLTLSITRGHNLLIMGPSSCGKTSLLRALRGLWPIQGGVLAYQSYRGPKAVMFLPQKPFLTNGTLREQIVYPEHLNNGPEPDTGCEGVVVDRNDENTANNTSRMTSGNSVSQTTSTKEVQRNDIDQCSTADIIDVEASSIPLSRSGESEEAVAAQSNSPLHTVISHNESSQRRNSSSEVGCAGVADVNVTIGDGGSVPNETSNTSAMDSDIKQWLSQLQMSSLLQRCGGLDTDPGWVWSDVLSPGEVQRLCFLRVLYHRPQFAILDEASSALSNDVEAALYTLAAKAGITVISVGHRNTLRQYHHSLLSLDGSGGWRLDALH